MSHLRRACLPLAALVICSMAPPAQAGQSLHLRASLTPNRFSEETTIGFDFTVTAPAGQVPSPLTAVALRYPGDVGIVVSGLGLDACPSATLHLLGPAGCPADARMGTGTATVEIPVGQSVVRENAAVTILRAETRDERFALTFFAEGSSPIVAQLSLPALLLSAHSPFGGSVAIEPPLVPSLPEAPNVSVVRLHAAIGPEHLTYYHRRHGKLVGYRPRGVRLPGTCPRGGWPFTAAVSFFDGTRAQARATVPCPRVRASRQHRRLTRAGG